MLTPLPAATVVTCRITTKWPYKILVLKRSETAKFLPGAHVFPGGRVEPEDDAFGAVLATDSANFRRIAEYFPKDDITVAKYLAAAIRETFEETSVSILRLSTRQPCTSAQLAEILHDPKLQASLKPCLDNIWPISWWITPLGEVRRFDTWFFLAMIEDSNELNALQCMDKEEGHDFRWISPADALEAYKNREIFLAPPTRSILERMACTESLNDFLACVDSPLCPIEPFFADAEGEKILILPGDPLHPQKIKSGLPVYTRYSFP